jgi:recombination protein RecA
MMVKNEHKGLEIWNQMEKLYGTDEFAEISAVETITSGSHALNDIIGPWGYPRGRVIQLAGKESSGKTLLSLTAIKEWQNLNPKNWALFIDAELAFDKSWAKLLGVDLDRLKIMRTNDGKKIFEYLCGVPHKEYGKAKAKPGLLDMVAEGGGADATGLGIIVLDSVASIMPPMEMTSAVGKANMALMARFLSDTLKKLIDCVSRSGVVFIATNHVRTDPGKLWGDPTTTPGGHAWKHHCSVMVHLIPVEAKDSKIFDKAGDMVGHTVRVRIDKNRVGPPHRTCEIRIKYDSGVIDKNVEIGDLAIKYKVVNRPNNRTYEYSEDKWVGKDNFYSALENTAIADKILKDIIAAKESGVEFDAKETEESEDSKDLWNLPEDN